MAYRQTGPEVVDYHRGSYDGVHHSGPSHFSGPTHESYVHHGPTSNIIDNREFVHTQNVGYGRNIQQPQPYWKLDEHHDNKNDKHRFDKYRPKDYKYNFFSLIDEPWNRCCEFGKCGNCPGNQCIAKNVPRRDWL